MINNYHATRKGSKLKQIAEKSELTVKIKTKEILPSKSDQIEEQQFLLDNAMTTKVLSLMELQGVTQEQAEEIIKAAEAEALEAIPTGNGENATSENDN